MDKYIDLHIHTTFSDGTMTPREILDLTVNSNIKAISITDHDTMDGYFDAVDIIEEYDVELICGVELSCEQDEKDIHILAYFPHRVEKEFSDYLRELSDYRKIRVHKIVEKLNDLGIDISVEYILSGLTTNSPGRLHIARALLKKGVIYSIKDAFTKYIGEDCPAYVKKKKLSVEECHRLVHQFGGLAVLAHPCIYNQDYLKEHLINKNIDGIEVFHSDHGVGDINRFIDLARRNRLLMTGGSDFHGMMHKSRPFGTSEIPYSLLEILRETHAEMY